MNIDTIDIDSNSLSARKEVSVESKQFETPAKALQVGKLRASETVSPLARGVVEIYAKADAAALENSRGTWTGLADKLERQSRNAEEDEFTVPFIEYDDTSDLDLENAKEIARLQTNQGDILTVPLMVSLVKAADDGDDRTTNHVASIIRNTQTFLEAVKELGIDKPVMGVVPPISEDCTRALVEQYMKFGLRAYCVDFHRRSPMAQSQIDHVVNPLMQTLTGYDIREESLLYAVNSRSSRRTKSDGRRTPDAVYAYVLGFDIIGDNHIPPNWPEEVFKDIAKKSKGDEVKLRLFDGFTVSVIEVRLSDLDSFLPDDAEISVERVRNRIENNQSEQYRFEKLINTELISLYLESEGGIDPSKIFTDLHSAKYAKVTDLRRIINLNSEVE